jgi:NAD(P)-dependent dehydrogenase (short-subunit alcohol dehydrogenase family)
VAHPSCRGLCWSLCSPSRPPRHAEEQRSARWIADVGHQGGSEGNLGHPPVAVASSVGSRPRDIISQTGTQEPRCHSAVIFLDNGLGSTRAEWLRTMHVNVVSGAILVRLAAPVMKAHGGAAIVNISSIAGKFANAGRILYTAAKAAVRQITKNEAVDLSDGAS